MRYDVYLAAGYPIGSGVAEGACRHLVKDRMEQTGMRWTVAGAQAMLHLRATYLNGDWEAFCVYRIQQEQIRLYQPQDQEAPVRASRLDDAQRGRRVTPFFKSSADETRESSTA